MPDRMGTRIRCLRSLVDSETWTHSCRVAQLGVSLARRLGLDGRTTWAIGVGGLLHDIGKGLVPEELLNKPGRLLPQERQVLEAHAASGAQFLTAVAGDLPPAVLDVVRHHHERLDGSGYPDRLHGDEISTTARVIAVADVYDALTSHRPYRKAMAREAALALVEQEAEAGKLDRRVVSALRAITAPPITVEDVQESPQPVECGRRLAVGYLRCSAD